MVGRPQNREKGFTLIELLVVVSIIGILAGAALVNVRHAERRARENVLRANLHDMRKAIDDYYADKQKFPGSLQDLAPNYMRIVPKDPLTDSADTWIEIFDEPSFDSSDPFGFETDFDSGDSLTPGVVDVKSGAEGTTMGQNPVPYGEL